LNRNLFRRLIPLFPRGGR